MPGVIRHIPYGRQNISRADIDAVVDVLQSDFITQGPAIERFEEAVAGYCGARYAVAVSSATAGLHIAYLAAGLGQGKRLWTSPNTFVATSNAALLCGASVDFVDIDPDTYNLDVEALALKLRQARLAGELPDVVVPVHFAGQSCEMAAIQELAAQYGFMLIEDASHAIGADYRQQPVGSCSFSEMAVFSFHPVKIITTGEGGMVLTNSEPLYRKLLRLRTHGITRHTDLMTREPDGPWYYEQLELGLNYRMTDLQAALGASQMTRLDDFITRRRELFARYNEKLAGSPVKLPCQSSETNSSHHLYVIQIDSRQVAKTRREVFDSLRAKGIGVNVHYIPVHTQPYYRSLGFKTGDFPATERYYEQAITLPLYYDLTDADQDWILESLKEALA